MYVTILKALIHLNSLLKCKYKPAFYIFSMYFSHYSILGNKICHISNCKLFSKSCLKLSVVLTTYESIWLSLSDVNSATKFFDHLSAWKQCDYAFNDYFTYEKEPWNYICSWKFGDKSIKTNMDIFLPELTFAQKLAFCYSASIINFSFVLEE